MNKPARISDEVKYEVADHVATITLNAPDRMNTISGPMLNQLTQHLLGKTPGVSGWTFGDHGIVSTGGLVVPAIGLTAGKGPLLSPTLLQGRPLVIRQRHDVSLRHDAPPGEQHSDLAVKIHCGEPLGRVYG